MLHCVRADLVARHLISIAAMEHVASVIVGNLKVVVPHVPTVAVATRTTITTDGLALIMEDCYEVLRPGRTRP